MNRGDKCHVHRRRIAVSEIVKRDHFSIRLCKACDARMMEWIRKEQDEALRTEKP